MNPELTQQLTKDYPEMFQYYNRRGAEYFVIVRRWLVQYY
jgi:hypothetical protein